MLEKISPSILGVKDFETFLNKLDELKEKGNVVRDIHFDVMDGEFVNSKRDLHTSLMIDLLERGYSPEVHLMVSERLEDEIMKAIKYGAKKIWIHSELEEVERYLNIVNGLNKKDEFDYVSIGLAINPDTGIDNIVILKDKIDSVLVMSVNPGKGGQKYIESSYEKIKRLRETLENVEIVVDGGINGSNIKKVFKSGADKVVMGHYLTENVKHMENKLMWIKKHILDKE